jgi:hypothetical protein
MVTEISHSLSQELGNIQVGGCFALLIIILQSASSSGMMNFKDLHSSTEFKLCFLRLRVGVTRGAWKAWNISFHQI